MRKIIINADDYGLSPLFNKGILELIKKEVVTSTTVMIKRKYIRPALLAKFKNISVGLHLELKEKDSKKEIEDQIAHFVKKFKHLPSHLDGHQHCHLTEPNFPNVIRVAKKYSLPVRSYAEKDRLLLKKNKIKTPNTFISWHPSRTDKIPGKFKDAQKKVTELVCHPGYYDKNSSYPYNKQREQELKFLRSKEFKSFVKNFEKINYNNL